MVDSGQIVDWSVAALLYVGLPLLLSSPSIRQRLGRVLRSLLPQPLGAERADVEEPFFRELAQATRSEDLRRDLDRLQHLLLIDDYMSATRQIANRMAYRIVRQQLLDSGDAPDPSYVSTAGTGAEGYRWAIQPGVTAYPSQRRDAQVEILDFGRR